MRSVAAITTLGFVLALTTSASALTYIFDPNDLVNLWEAGAPDPDDGVDPSGNPRSIYDPGTSQGYPAYTGIGDWNAAGTGSALDDAIGSDFNDWRDNGGFITSFNIWLADNPNARGWGETLVIKPYTGLSATADAAGLWDVEVSTNEWHSDLYYAQWWANDNGDALKLEGTDVGEFSFTAPLYIDGNENGWDETDSPAVLGEDYTIWFGGYGAGDDDFGTDVEGYGTTDGLMYQGALSITAVPEPLTMLGVFSGVVGIGAYIRKRRMG